jgi:hypothetical protein
VAVGKDETEVRREDQDKINRFSRLHAKESVLDDELKQKKVCSSRGVRLSADSQLERQGRLGRDFGGTGIGR